MIPTTQLYDTYIAEFPLEDIQLHMLDSLSGYSNTRITVGAIRDDHFGLTTRACAFSLIPMHDTLDWGVNPEFQSFHLSSVLDTISVSEANQKDILQNLNVYELTEAPTVDKYDINGTIAHSSKRISKGIPVYTGKDSLSFFFTKEFGEKYMSMTTEDLEDIDSYLEKFPGIYIDTDAPVGNGGRINMFTLQLGYNSKYYYIDGNYAKLNFRSTYDGVCKDTTFFYYFGADDLYDVDSLLNNAGDSKFPQYCYDLAGHETRSMEGRAGKEIKIEGGGGLKPVVSATEIKEKLYSEFLKHTDNPKDVVINRATLFFPFEFPEDYTKMDQYPEYLNPFARVSYSDYVSYASITDTSSSTEDPGKVNRSLMQYAPDITFHVQGILLTDESTNLSNYNIWMLLMKEEVEKEDEDDTSAQDNYYNALSMAQYMNMMYGGYGGYGGYGYGGYGYGYGGYGYGGYGGYGSGYSNIYTYAMLASMYSNSSSSTTSSVEIDRDRYYDATLIGPDADSDRVPTIKVVYSVPRE